MTPETTAGAPDRPPRPNILEVEGLVKTFASRVAQPEPLAEPERRLPRIRFFGNGGAPKGRIPAVDDVSFTVGRGEVVALVGESGSGKSTLARCLLGLMTQDDGQVRFEGKDVRDWLNDSPMRFRQQMQMVFQHPDLSLNPRFTVFRTIAEVLHLHGIGDASDRRDRVAHLLERVQLDPAVVMNRLPRQLSGGQRQRVGIARALATQPRFVVLDEPTSALDASVQTRVLDLLLELRESEGLSYLFISHDLNVVRFMSSRVVVLYLGRVMEEGPTEDIFASPQHPYTRALLSAAPVADPRHRYDDRHALRGEAASAVAGGERCPLVGRCMLEHDACRTSRPLRREVGPGHTSACHIAEDLEAYSPPAFAGAA